MRLGCPIDLSWEAALHLTPRRGLHPPKCPPGFRRRQYPFAGKPHLVPSKIPKFASKPHGWHISLENNTRLPDPPACSRYIPGMVSAGSTTSGQQHNRFDSTPLCSRYWPVDHPDTALHLGMGSPANAVHGEDPVQKSSEETSILQTGAEPGTCPLGPSPEPCEAPFMPMDVS